jgi:parallel beta-helix repeat protein
MILDNLHIDNYLKFEHSEINNSTADDNTLIGATKSTDRTLDFTPDDTNSVYVSKAGNDTTGDGTAANPYLTIKQANTAVTATKCNIVIADSGTYVEDVIDIDTDCARIVAAVGFTPIIEPSSSLVGTVPEDYFCDTAVDTFLLEPGFVTKGAHLSNGETVLIYQNSSYTVCAKFLSSNGTELRNDVELFTYPPASPIPYYGNFSVCALASGHFVVTVNVWDGSAKVNLAVYIFTNAGVQTYYNYFSSIRSYNNAVCALEGYTDRFVVAVSSQTDSYGTRYMIMNDNGDILTSITQISTDRAQDCSLNVIADADSGFVVLYRVYTGNAVWYHYNSSGTCIHSAGSIATGALYPTAVIYDGLILFAVNDSSNNIIFVEYSLSTHLVTKTAATVATLTSSDKPSIIQLTNGAFCVSAGDTPAGLFYLAPDWSLIGSVEYFENIKVTGGSGLVRKVNITYDTTNERVFLYYEKLNTDEIYLNIKGGFLTDWITITSDLNFNGITFDCDNDQVKHYLKTSGASAYFEYCTFQNIEYGDYADSSVYPIVKSTSTANTFNKCLVKNSQRGFDITSDSVAANNNLIYSVSYSPAFKITGSGANIIFNHNTVFNNQIGLELVSNAGTEVIKNSIFSNNQTAVKAETSVLIKNCCIPDPLDNATYDLTSSTLNPLFISDGYVTTMDLHLQSKVLDYAFDSPALGIADDSKDAGCYDVTYTLNPASYISFVIPKPKTIIPNINTVNKIVNVMQDGSVDVQVDAYQLEISLEWDSVLKRYVNSIIKMFMAEGDIRIYFNPATYPTIYEEMKLVTKELPLNSDTYTLTDSGFNKFKLEFVRKFQLSELAV